MSELLVKGMITEAVRTMFGVVGSGKYDVDLLHFDAKEQVAILEMARE